MQLILIWVTRPDVGIHANKSTKIASLKCRQIPFWARTFQEWTSRIKGVAEKSL